MNGRSRFLLAACALLPRLCGAQVDSASVRQVLATEDRRFAAMVRADTGALEQLLATDLTYTHTDGVQNTRQECRSAMRVESGGQTHAFRIRYLAVYDRGARGWELTAWQSTRLPR